MLGNFVYHNPTKLYFGDKSLDNLNDELKNYGKNIMLIYGGGSIKNNGIYDEVIKILKDNGKNIFEDSGVMSNPTLEKLNEGRKIAKENNIDFILAVGGGSVCDYSKCVSAFAHSDGNVWKRYFENREVVANKTIPLGCVLTMVGTGSEMNAGAVITNSDLKLKLGYGFGIDVFPKFSILNPKFTFSLPKYQMVAGIYDIMSHIFEQYFSDFDDNTSDYIMEGMLRSIIHSSKIAVKNPTDYEARSNIMWTATWALNTFVAKGKTTDWMVHMIGHSISAYTGATHGMTLAAVSIPYYKKMLPYAVEKFKKYAINVWDVNPVGKTDEEIAKEGLVEMEKFMREIGLVMNIKDLGVTEDIVDKMADVFAIRQGGYKVLTKEEIAEIYRESMTL